MNIHVEENHKQFLETIKTIKTTKEKIFLCFKFVLDDSEENLRHFNGYKEYVSIVLSDENDVMCEFNGSCKVFFDLQLRKIIQEGIDNNELIPEAMNLAEGLLVFEKGLALLKMSQKNFDAKYVGESFLNNLWELIKVK